MGQPHCEQAATAAHGWARMPLVHSPIVSCINICDSQAVPCMCKASSSSLPSAPSSFRGAMRMAPGRRNCGGDAFNPGSALLAVLLPQGELCALTGTHGRQKQCAGMSRSSCADSCNKLCSEQRIACAL